MKNAIINLSAELLNSGVFNHLSDEEISQLHRLLLQHDLNKSDKQILALISFWYKGDYFSSPASQRLLQKSNECLQRIAQPLIETFSMEEIFEMG